MDINLPSVFYTFIEVTLLLLSNPWLLKSCQCICFFQYVQITCRVTGVQSGFGFAFGLTLQKLLAACVFKLKLSPYKCRSPCIGTEHGGCHCTVLGWSE